MPDSFEKLMFKSSIMQQTYSFQQASLHGQTGTPLHYRQYENYGHIHFKISSPALQVFINRQRPVPDTLCLHVASQGASPIHIQATYLHVYLPELIY